MKRILVVAAHPDDEILGCGGTIARLISKGCEVCSLVLSNGVDSRGSDTAKKEQLKREMQKANEMLGVKEVRSLAFPDNAFDGVPLLSIIKEIERIKNELRPDTIFTHSANDLNIDHQITYKAVLTATRPMKGESVKEIYSFYIPSSSEWAFPLRFSPNIFFDITSTIDLKCDALACYTSEMREPPHPRSIENIKTVASFFGFSVGCDAAEAFECVRVLR